MEWKRAAQTTEAGRLTEDLILGRGYRRCGVDRSSGQQPAVDAQQAAVHSRSEGGERPWAGDLGSAPGPNQAPNPWLASATGAVCGARIPVNHATGPGHAATAHPIPRPRPEVRCPLVTLFRQRRQPDCAFRHGATRLESRSVGLPSRSPSISTCCCSLPLDPLPPHRHLGRQSVPAQSSVHLW